MDIVFSRTATALGLGARLMLSLGSSGICQKQRMCCDGELDGGYVPTIPDSFEPAHMRLLFTQKTVISAQFL